MTNGIWEVYKVENWKEKISRRRKLLKSWATWKWFSLSLLSRSSLDTLLCVPPLSEVTHMAGWGKGCLCDRALSALLQGNSLSASFCAR